MEKGASILVANGMKGIRVVTKDEESLRREMPR